MSDLRELLADPDPRRALCALLQDFHARDWISGTGGGICGRADADSLWVAPTGVHKELVRPEEFFRISIEEGTVLDAPAGLEPSECAPIFRAIVRATGAGSVVHSHALSAVLAADHSGGGVLSISGFEMLKGLGVKNTATHEVAVIVNTERERDLTDAVATAVADERFAAAKCVVVADHGCYLWGRDVAEAKKHAEVYHWLFEALVARWPRS
ncbi:MAG: methylthioribulose 1-phosphate dehydratase [Actinomycetota bacterium]